ncbi:MAG: ion channel [Acidimicrobiia bacterium]|nr:ion channel [Acidimicrobiia bacterium]
MVTHDADGHRDQASAPTEGDATSLEERLKPGWELPAIAALYFSLFVLRDAGPPNGLDFDVARGIIVLGIIVLTVRAARIPTQAGAIHIALAAMVLVIDIVSAGADASWVDVITKGLSVYLVGYSTIALLVFLLRRRRISGDAIFGAAAVYLSIGILFGLIYTLIGTIDPEAFDPPQTVVPGSPSQLYYFSYVTLTTLGFGDIQPAASITRVLAALEAIVGVVLLAALVGRFVGMLVSQASEENIMKRLDQAVSAIGGNGPRADGEGTSDREPADERVDDADAGDDGRADTEAHPDGL